MFFEKSTFDSKYPLFPKNPLFPKIPTSPRNPFPPKYPICLKLSHRKLPRLRSINLSNNQLTSISRGSLPDSIEDAWLDSNLVETISRKIFSNLSNMKRVYLMNVSTNSMPPINHLLHGRIRTNRTGRTDDRVCLDR